MVDVGAGLPQLSGLAGEAKSFVERLFALPLIGSLTAEQSAEALRLPAEDLGVAFDDDALKVSRGSSSHPKSDYRMSAEAAHSDRRRSARGTVARYRQLVAPADVSIAQ
jgi:hypothetical protein